MKKLALTIAIVLGLSMTTFADGGGLFNRANNANNGGSGYSYFSGSKGVTDPPPRLCLGMVRTPTKALPWVPASLCWPSSVAPTSWARSAERNNLK